MLFKDDRLTLKESGPVHVPGMRNVCMNPTAAFAVASLGKSRAAIVPEEGSGMAFLYPYSAVTVAVATEEIPMGLVAVSTLL